MEPQNETNARSPFETRRKLIRQAIEKIEADNARLRDERNALRWKTERDPEEYESQKELQRRQYADAQGGSVRAYKKIKAKTRREHREQAQARDAARQKKRYDAMTPFERQEKSDRTADDAWCRRRRAQGMSEDEIRTALAKRINERNAKRVTIADQEKADQAAMRALPAFGIV